MTNQQQTYSLMNLSYLLPISDRDSTLKWLKSKHEEAMAAEVYGHRNAVIIQTNSLVVTSDRLLDNIDSITGNISKECARMLVDIISGGGFPDNLIALNRKVDSDFMTYAYSA